MARQQYFGHTVEGTAVLIGEDCWKATGRVEQRGALLAQSCDIGSFRTAERAMAEGLAWSKHWIDCNQRVDRIPTDAGRPAHIHA
nr:hypothetical protein [uncultured Cupriavidus sp.]